MENKNNSWSHQSSKFIAISNIVGVVLVSWFCYKYYSNSGGNGFEELLFNLSIYSLYSFFGSIAFLEYNLNRSRAKQWLLVGMIFIIGCSTYIGIEIFKGDIGLFFFIINSVPFLLYSMSLIYFKYLDKFYIIISVIRLGSLLAIAFPIMVFCIMMAGYIWMLFYKG